MIQRTGPNVQEHKPDASLLRHETPDEECIGKTPRSASLRELATTADNQKIKRSKYSVRFNQESQFAKCCPGQTNRGVPCLSKPVSKFVPARLSRFYCGRSLAGIPSVSSNGVGWDSVPFGGVVRVHRKHLDLRIVPPPSNIAHDYVYDRVVT